MNAPQRRPTPAGAGVLKSAASSVRPSGLAAEPAPGRMTSYEERGTQSSF
jgi:hypothetical protein